MNLLKAKRIFEMRLLSKIGRGLENHRKLVCKIKQKSIIYLLCWRKFTFKKIFKSWKIYLKNREMKKSRNEETLYERHKILSKNSIDI